MLIKRDFVTNSSSTSYIFVFRGRELNDLYSVMKDNWRSFEFIDEIYNVNVYEVIKIINEKDYVKVIDINDKIKEIEKNIITYKRLIKDERDKSSIYLEYYKDEIEKDEKLIELLKYKERKGFKSISTCGFSDHNGNLSECKMRYERIKIDNDKLVVLVTGNE